MCLVNHLIFSFLFFGGLAATELDSSDAISRVVGGKDAPEGALPYQVSLQLPKSNNRHICGGAIISDRWILTAAHCTPDLAPKDLVCLVGTNSKTRGGTRYTIDKIVNHEKYSRTPKNNDIALLRTTDQIKFTDKVKPIQIATEDPEPGEMCTLSGWGYTTMRRGRAPDKLKMLSVRVLSEKQCKTKKLMQYEKTFPITPNQICILNGRGQGGCQGDSGGSLVCKNKSVGVVSWNIPCAQGDPDVFTRVSRYQKWINKTMEANKP